VNGKATGILVAILALAGLGAAGYFIFGGDSRGGPTANSRDASKTPGGGDKTGKSRNSRNNEDEPGGNSSRKGASGNSRNPGGNSGGPDAANGSPDGSNSPGASNPNGIPGDPSNQNGSGSANPNGTNPNGAPGTAPGTTTPDPNTPPAPVFNSAIPADAPAARLTPTIATSGGPDGRIIEQRGTVPVRRRGTNPGLPAILDNPKRLVSGRVVEKRNGVDVPLEGVIITDWREIHRTISDANGAFSFEVRYADDGPQNFDQAGRDSADRDSSPNNDYVVLTAYADGYIQTGNGVSQGGEPGRRYYSGQVFTPEQVNSEAGCTVTMQWQGTETIKVRAVNAPSNTKGITVVCESVDQHGAQRDQNFYLTAPLDEKGEASFTIPPRRQLEIYALGASNRSKGSARYNQATGYWELTLGDAESRAIRGRLIEARAGAPVAGARLLCNTGEDTAFSAADGSFTLYTKTGASQHNMVIDHPGYALASCVLEQAATSTQFVLEGGSAPEGPWVITLRPLIRMKGSIARGDGGSIEKLIGMSAISEGQLRENVPATLVGGRIEFESYSFPWGATKMELTVTEQPPTSERPYPPQVTLIALIPSTVWGPNNEYDLVFSAGK
jgi:hypothetical protein